MLHMSSKLQNFTGSTITGLCYSFAPPAAPWLTKLANAALSGRLTTPGPTRVQLAREAVDNLEKLGPTYCKLGQIMSIRWARCMNSM